MRGVVRRVVRRVVGGVMGVVGVVGAVGAGEDIEKKIFCQNLGHFWSFYGVEINISTVSVPILLIFFFFFLLNNCSAYFKGVSRPPRRLLGCQHSKKLFFLSFLTEFWVLSLKIFLLVGRGKILRHAEKKK